MYTPPHTHTRTHAHTHTPCTHTQGFVPANNDEFRSENIVPAAFAAIDEINNDCSYLPGYELVLEFVDTRVSVCVCVGGCA